MKEKLHVLMLIKEGLKPFRDKRHKKKYDGWLRDAKYMLEKNNLTNEPEYTEVLGWIRKESLDKIL